MRESAMHTKSQAENSLAFNEQCVFLTATAGLCQRVGNEEEKRLLEHRF